MTFDQPMEVFRGTSLIIKSIIIYKGGEGKNSQVHTHIFQLMSTCSISTQFVRKN